MILYGKTGIKPINNKTIVVWIQQISYDITDR